MSRIGPGEYVPDRSEGITKIGDLPRAMVVECSRNHSRQTCPGCGKSAYRDRVYRRKLHDVGDVIKGRPREIALTYSQHYCSRCQKYFNVDSSDIAPPGSQYTNRVITLTIRLVAEDGLAYQATSWHLWRDHRVFVPFSTVRNWVQAGGKKIA
jgi:transposase